RDLSEPVAAKVVHLPGPAPATETMPAPTLSGPDASAGPVNFNETIETLEKKLIEAALEFCRGHQRKAADHLGLSYHQMRGLLRKTGYGREAGEESSPKPPEVGQ